MVPGQFSNQVHDFDPGITSNGLFWTVPIPLDSVQTNLDQGTASLTITNLSLLDYGNVPNALMRGASVPATVSYKVTWQTRARVRTSSFVGDFSDNTATIECSAQRQGFTFVSDPASSSVTAFALLGRERNGVFR